MSDRNPTREEVNKMVYEKARAVKKKLRAKLQAEVDKAKADEAEAQRRADAEAAEAQRRADAEAAEAQRSANAEDIKKLVKHLIDIGVTDIGEQERILGFRPRPEHYPEPRPGPRPEPRPGPRPEPRPEPRTESPPETCPVPRPTAYGGPGYGAGHEGNERFNASVLFTRKNPGSAPRVNKGIPESCKTFLRELLQRIQNDESFVKNVEKTSSSTTTKKDLVIGKKGWLKNEDPKRAKAIIGKMLSFMHPDKFENRVGREPNETEKKAMRLLSAFFGIL